MQPGRRPLCSTAQRSGVCASPAPTASTSSTAFPPTSSIDLQPGRGAATVLTTNKGRILDLLVVANLGEELLVITSPGNPGAG